jgi:uncharacterized repeat protein (TIGR01451 family)
MQTTARVALGLFLLSALSVAADVTATKSVSGTFVQGTDVTYTIVLTNGMAVAQDDNPGDEFRDDLPAGLVFVSAEATSGTAVYLTTIGAVGWNGAIPSGESVTITLVAMIGPAAAGTISNQGQVSFDADGDGVNESSGLTDDPSTGAANDPTSFNIIQSGEVTATKSVSGTFVQGTDVTYTIVITNSMTVAVTNEYAHEFTDVLPSGLTFVSASATSGTAGSCCGNVVFWDGALAAGESTTLTVVATISPTASGTISNQGQTIFSRDGDEHYESSHLTDDPSTAAVDDATSFNVIQSGEVTATKSVSGTFVQGTDVTYTVVITNNMTVALTNEYAHEFTDVLPAGLTFVSASATSGTAGSCCGNVVFWDGALAAGESTTLTIVATISPTASGTLSNQGQTIFSRDGDEHYESSHLTDDPSTAAVDDATSFNVIQSGIVECTKSVSGTFVQGTNVTYTIVLTNNMTVTQNDNFGHEFADILPSQLTLVSVNATSGTVAAVISNTAVVWNGSIPAGGTVTITIVCTINPTATGTISNQGNSIFDRNGDNQNESEEFTDDPSTAADDDATFFNVIQSGIVEITKSVSGTFVQGTNVTYTIVLTNNMTVTQPDNFGHEATDSLPAGLTFVSAAASSGTVTHCCGSPGFVLWNGSIPAGGSVTITITASIDSTASGTISNAANSIFDRNGDGQNESEEWSDDPSTAAVNDATSFTVIANQADLSLTMTYLPAAPGQNDDVTYTLVVANNGPLTATNVVVTDDRPDDASFLSASSTQGSCTTADPVVCSVGSLASGASATMTLLVKTPGSYSSLTNSATATADQPDPTPATASATFSCMKLKKGVLKPCTSN